MIILVVPGTRYGTTRVVVVLVVGSTSYSSEVLLASTSSTVPGDGRVPRTLPPAGYHGTLVVLRVGLLFLLYRTTSYYC